MKFDNKYCFYLEKNLWSLDSYTVAHLACFGLLHKSRVRKLSDAGDNEHMQIRKKRKKIVATNRKCAEATSQEINVEYSSHSSEELRSKPEIESATKPTIESENFSSVPKTSATLSLNEDLSSVELRLSPIIVNQRDKNCVLTPSQNGSFQSMGSDVNHVITVKISCWALKIHEI